MGLFDVIEDISEKNIAKTETGDNRIFGIVVGEVVDNYDQERSGRICVLIHTRDSDANVLKWAKVAAPYIGKSWGMYFLPEVGDQVLVAFDQGNIERPYVIGCIPKDSDKFLTKSKDEQNQKKRIQIIYRNMPVRMLQKQDMLKQMIQSRYMLKRMLQNQNMLRLMVRNRTILIQRMRNPMIMSRTKMTKILKMLKQRLLLKSLRLHQKPERALTRSS